MSWTTPVWWKHGAPEGVAVISVFDKKTDPGRAWVSLDGNWNHDCLPFKPDATYEEVCRFLSRCAVAPPWTSDYRGQEGIVRELTEHELQGIRRRTINSLPPEARWSGS